MPDSTTTDLTDLDRLHLTLAALEMRARYGDLSEAKNLLTRVDELLGKMEETNDG